MLKISPLTGDGSFRVKIGNGRGSVILDTDDVSSLLNLLVQSGKLLIMSTNQDWAYEKSEVMIDTDTEGHVYLTPCDGESRPEYRLAEKAFGDYGPDDHSDPCDS